MEETIFAQDTSTSTRGIEFYHQNTAKIFRAAQEQSSNMTILLWNHLMTVGSVEELQEITSQMRGTGCTDPSPIAEYIKDKSFHGKLVLITDGQVGQGEVEKCTKLLGMEWKFSSTEVHLIETNMAVNLSVPCPFTRNTPHTVYKYTKSGVETVVSITAEDLELIKNGGLLDTIKTEAEFSANFPKLDKVVLARTMGSDGDPTLRDKLIAMKKRIVQEQATLTGKGDTVKELIAAVKSSSPSALELAKKATDEYYSIDPTWSTNLDRLVLMCDGALKGSFDLSGVDRAIQGDRARRAKVVDAVPVADLAKKEVDLTADPTADTLLLLSQDGAPVLEGIPYKTVNTIVNCPLEVFNYPEVLDRIKAKLDHPVSLSEYLKTPLSSSPVTHRPVAGGIALGCNRQQVSYTTSTLAKVISDGKLLGSPDLWFAVLWLIVASGDVPHLLPLADQFRAQMKWRCERSTTFMSLQGLPELPTTKVPLGVAAWYVLAASAFSPSGKTEPIRAHITHAKPLIALQALTGYALPSEVQAHVDRMQMLSELLESAKNERPKPPPGFIPKPRKRERLQLQKQKKSEVLNKIAELIKAKKAQQANTPKIPKKHIIQTPRIPNIAQALFQNTIPIDQSKISAAVKEREGVPLFVPIDGPATEATAALALRELPLKFQSYPKKLLFAMASLIDTQRSFKGVALPYDFQAFADEKWKSTKAANDWSYNHTAYSQIEVAICPETCRPYSTNWRGVPWRASAKSAFGFPATDMWSVNKHFGDFVCKYEKYPTVDELLVFSHNRFAKASGSEKKTLPFAAATIAADSIRRFATTTGALSPIEFKRRYRFSASVPKRQAMEAKPLSFRKLLSFFPRKV